MKREFLKGLELSEEQIDRIMAEYGRSVERFKEDGQTIAQLNDRLEEANRELAALREYHPEELKKSAEEWKARAEQAERESAVRERDSLLREGLGEWQFSSEYARQGVFRELRALPLTVENGAIAGLSQAVDAIREKNPDAFVQGEKPQFAAAVRSAVPETEAQIRSVMGLPE